MKDEEKEEKIADKLSSTVKKRDWCLYGGIIANVLLFISVVFEIDFGFKISGVEIKKIEDHTIMVLLLTFSYFVFGILSALFSHHALKIRNLIKNKNVLDIWSLEPNILINYPISMTVIIFLSTFTPATLFFTFFKCQIVFSILYGVILASPFLYVIVSSKKLLYEVNK